MKDKFSFKKEYRARTIFRIFNVMLLVITMLIMIVPILKIISDSLDATSSYSMNIIPRKITFGAYIKIFSSKELRTPFMVSMYTTVVGTALGLLLTTLGAYVLLQKQMPGNRFFTWTIFFTMIFNGGLVPTYLLIKNLGLMNNLWAVILPLSFNVYNLILMKSFFEGIPSSLMEAAEIDGCTPIGIFWRIVLPLSKPALASIGLFFAVDYWNHFFNFVMYITDTNKYNFQVKLRSLVLDSDNLQNANSDGNSVFGKTMENAAVIVSMIPPMILYPFCQKYFVQGVTLGAVKE